MHLYAAGLALAERLGAELCCDTSFYRRYRPDRPLSLQAFGLAWTSCHVPPFRGLRKFASDLHLVHDPFRGAPILRSQVDFDPMFLRLEAPCSLSGYFQSWRYLEGHEAAVRAAFDTDKLVTPRIAPIEAEIRAAQNPVAVHVRRTDYVRSPEAISRFGRLDADHYRRAQRAIEARIDAPTYFLFTDDPQMALADLAGWEGLRLVTGFTALEDLRLMTLCRHFIIANSTFSWWGAWLGRASDKLVVAPAAWFGPAHPPINMDDKLPPEWIRV